MDWELELVRLNYTSSDNKHTDVVSSLLPLSFLSSACSARPDPLPPVQPTKQPLPGGGGSSGGSSSGGSGSGGSGSGGSGFCAGKSNGLYPDPTNKNNFYECNQGKTYVQHCAISLVFDDSCKCCNWA